MKRWVDINPSVSGISCMIRCQRHKPLRLPRVMPHCEKRKRKPDIGEVYFVYNVIQIKYISTTEPV